jgi:hypothetical protein
MANAFDFATLLNEIHNLTASTVMTLDDNDNTYLHHVVQYPCKDTANIVRRLMRQHVIVDHQNIFGQTVFQLAARHCAPDILEILFNEPGDFFNRSQEIDLDDVHGNTLAHYASAQNIEIISIYDFNLNKKNNNGRTPLMEAIVKKDIEKIIQLLEFGANPNISDSEGNNAIHYSLLIAKESIEDFNKILQKFIEIHSTIRCTDEGLTAKQSSSSNFIQTNRYGNTILDNAIQSNMIDATRIIWNTWCYKIQHLDRWFNSVGGLNPQMRTLLKTLSESRTSFKTRYA